MVGGSNTGFGSDSRWMGITFWDVDEVYRHPCDVRARRSSRSHRRRSRECPRRAATPRCEPARRRHDGWSHGCADGMVVPADFDFSPATTGTSTVGRTWGRRPVSAGPGAGRPVVDPRCHDERLVVDAMYMPSGRCRGCKELWQVVGIGSAPDLVVVPTRVVDSESLLARWGWTKRLLTGRGSRGHRGLVSRSSAGCLVTRVLEEAGRSPRRESMGVLPCHGPQVDPQVPGGGARRTRGPLLGTSSMPARAARASSPAHRPRQASDEARPSPSRLTSSGHPRSTVYAVSPT